MRQAFFGACWLRRARMWSSSVRAHAARVVGRGRPRRAPLALALAAALAGSGIAADAVLGAGSASSDTTHPPAGATNSDAKVVRELPKLRTATSDTYLLADGAREVRAFAQPVNYRNAAGEWTPISDALQQANDGSFHPAASPVAVSLPSTLASGPVSVGSGESALSFALQDALPGQASSAGARRTYAGVMPGVSASLTAAPGALRELLRLESAAAPSTYTYALSYGPLLHASLTPQGALTFRNNAGKLIYTIPAPTLADSSAHGREAQSAPARYELSANGRTLTLLIDKAWLDSPARVFPVKVDPDVAFGEAAGCTIANESYAGTSLCASSEPLTVGVQGESPKIIRRSLIRFELSSIPRGSVIISSNLRLFFSEEQWEDIPIEVEAYGLTRSFTSGATWDSFNGSKPWSTPGGDYETTLAGHNTIYNSERGGWVTFGFTPLVERWVQQPGSNHGVLLKAHDESATGFDVFAQSDNGEELGEPYMQVIYSPRLGDQEAAMVTAGELAGGAEALVNVTNGNLFVESPDVEYSGEGYETDLTRFYNSQDEEVLATGAFGPGWRIGAGEDALLYSAWWDASQTFHEPGGAYARFDPSPPGSAEAHPWQLTYNPPPGLEASLSAHEDGTRTLTYEESGTEWLFDSSEYGFPTEIVEHEGAGNTISLSYTEGANRDLSSLSDSHGDSLTIKREAAGEEGDRIAKIEGTGGKTWTYAYNSYGQLSSYEGPAGEKTSYGYHEWLLHTIEDSSGTYVVSYDEADPRRVTSVRRIVNGTLETVGSEDEITSFEYLSPQSPTCNPETDIGETVVKYTPGGEEATEAYCYDAAGEITNWSGPEPEELPGEEDNSEELQEVPLGTCYENPEFPTAPGSCGEEDVPPEAEEGLEGSLNEVEVDPKDIAPKHYGIADENSLSAFPLFKNPYFEQLHVLDVRRQIP